MIWFFAGKVCQSHILQHMASKDILYYYLVWKRVCITHRNIRLSQWSAMSVTFGVYFLNTGWEILWTKSGSFPYIIKSLHDGMGFIWISYINPYMQKSIMLVPAYAWAFAEFVSNKAGWSLSCEMHAQHRSVHEGLDFNIVHPPVGTIQDKQAHYWIQEILPKMWSVG